MTDQEATIEELKKEISSLLEANSNLQKEVIDAGEETLSWVYRADSYKDLLGKSIDEMKSQLCEYEGMFRGPLPNRIKTAAYVLFGVF